MHPGQGPPQRIEREKIYHVYLYYWAFSLVALCHSSAFVLHWLGACSLINKSWHDVKLRIDTSIITDT